MGEAGDVVARARRGDRAAWDELVARFARMVLAVARSQGLREADRDDVAQVTWLKLAQNLDRLANPDAVGAWLATTCRRESLRFGARSAREVPAARETFDRIVDAFDVEEHVMRGERDRQLSSAFARLSARCQLLLRLLLLDRPYEEIGVVMEMPVGSIGPTRQRCLGKLRERLPAGSGITSSSSDS